MSRHRQPASACPFGAMKGNTFETWGVHIRKNPLNGSLRGSERHALRGYSDSAQYCSLSEILHWPSGRNSCGYLTLTQAEVANATLLFDIKDGHRLVDPLGQDFKNDEAAIAKAKVIAIGVSLDKPAVDPERRIAVLNESREQIFSVPVYSKPSMSNG